MKFLIPSATSTDKVQRFSARTRGLLLVENMGHPHTYVTDVKDCNKEDLVVVAKDHNEKHINYLLENNIKYIYDVSDNHWHRKKFSKSWLYTAKHSLQLTTTCDYLAEVSKKYTGKTVTVIPDLTERQEEPAKFNPQKEIKMVWYGARINFNLLDWADIVKKIKAVNFNTQIDVITNKSKEMPKEYIDWSFETQGDYVRNCDIVLLPLGPQSEHSLGKGNNRPVDAIRQGRFVITTAGSPSYNDLKDYMWIGDIAEGYSWALDNPDLVLEKIRAGQKYIEKNYSPTVIANKWIKLSHELC